MPIPRFLCAPPPNHEKSRRGLGGALIPAEVFTHWERPPAEAQGRRDGNWTTNRRRPRLHGSSTESPLCASAPLRENLPRSLCARPIRASPPSNRSDRRAEAGSGSQRDTTVQTCRFAALLGPPTVCQLDPFDPSLPREGKKVPFTTTAATATTSLLPSASAPLRETVPFAAPRPPLAPLTPRPPWTRRTPRTHRATNHRAGPDPSVVGPAGAGRPRTVNQFPAGP